MRPPKAVIFDIGNVLITWNPERLYDEVIGVDARKEMFKNIDLHGMNARVDRGEAFRETVYEEAEKHPKYRDMIRLWHDRWIEMASPRIDGSWRILRALKAQGIPVFALSNFGIESFAYAETKYPELGEFDQRFISGHMGVIKPEMQIYEMLEVETGLNQDALFFTDDLTENIEAARARGWHGHVFEGADGLQAALMGVGIDVS